MKQDKFIEKLQIRLKEQEKIMQKTFLSKLFSFIANNFGIHPWRILIPFSIITSIILHFYFHKSYDDLILKIFGGFGIIKL